jgi:hypothetical protein
MNKNNRLGRVLMCFRQWYFGLAYVRWITITRVLSTAIISAGIVGAASAIKFVASISNTNKNGAGVSPVALSDGVVRSISS